MTVGTTITNAQGVVSTNNTTGLSVQQDPQNVGFSPFPVQAVVALVSTSVGGTSPVVAPGQAGVLTMSGSFGALTVVLPTAAAAIGGDYIFRNLDAVAHILTASQEVGGTKNIVSASNGGLFTKVTMAAVVGSSVTMYSDGVQWFITQCRGANSASVL